MELNAETISASTRGEFLFRLFNVEVGPMQRNFREHHHTQIEMVLFKEGTGRYTVLGKEYDIRPGDIFLFAGNEVHCITRIDGPAPMRLMNLHFEPRFIWSPGNDQLDAGYLLIFFARSEQFENRLDRDNPATAVIRRLILQIEEECSAKPRNFELMTKVYLLQILTLLGREYPYTTENAQLYRQNFFKVEAAIQYINQNLAGDLTLEEIAGVAGMSRAYFSTVFKKINGVSPWDYILARRIEHAIGLMETGDHTILEIASLCGFNNTANFNRSFRKITGKTPSEYRRDGFHNHF